MLNRLLGIVYLLLNKKSVTAKELAERFEVSVRTIYRDVENLSMAGIPIYTRKGKNGGISLTSQFVLNKMLVTKEEQDQILAALASLQETGALKEKETMSKLTDFFMAEPTNWVAIDFSDWSGRRQELFEKVREAILSHRVLTFDYYGQSGSMTRRVAEPLQLLFKEYTWYLRAFCRDREDMRLFKLLRMKRVEVTDEIFSPRRHKEVTLGTKLCPKADPLADCGQEGSRLTMLTLLIDKSEAFRVYDRFEEEEITVLENGDFLIHVEYLMDEWVYGVIFSFGAAAEVLEPEAVKQEVLRRLKKMQLRYEME
ncbi:MAG: YafY family transcriptional regulator [Lachnospiraceae bacterium]|nr:YafY family transcriptional regulator [Lachnospiraceae bacterium]